MIASIVSWISQIRSKFEGISCVSAKDVKQKMQDGPVRLLDVRSEKEIEISIVKGAVVLEDFLRDAENNQNYANQTIYVYCTTGERSRAKCGELKSQFPNAEFVNVVGGVIDFANEGFAFVDPNGRPTNRIHTFNSWFDSLPNGYEAVTDKGE